MKKPQGGFRDPFNKVAELTSMLRDILFFISLRAAPPGGRPILDESSGYELSNVPL